jgi:flagella basal body P-ring formation protein FlgA
MTLLTLGGLAATDLAAQTAVPAPLEARVSETIARAWQVPQASIHLEWGHVPSAYPLSAEAPFRLLGQGTDGEFVLAFDLAGGRQSAVKVRAGVIDSVLIASRPLPAGTRLALTDLTMSSRLQWGPPRRTEGPQPGPGWIVKHSLAMGAALLPPAVNPPPLVEAGAPIKLQWESGAVSVAVAGVAVNEAGLGQLVQVRTTGRAGLVRGIVTGPGTARMEQR